MNGIVFVNPNFFEYTGHFNKRQILTSSVITLVAVLAIAMGLIAIGKLGIIPAFALIGGGSILFTFSVLFLFDQFLIHRAIVKNRKFVIEENFRMMEEEKFTASPGVHPCPFEFAFIPLGSACAVIKKTNEHPSKRTAYFYLSQDAEKWGNHLTSYAEGGGNMHGGRNCGITF
jgi:hypothetical protein